MYCACEERTRIDLFDFNLRYPPTIPIGQPNSFCRCLFVSYGFGMELTETQEQRLVDEGYLHLRNIVPQPLINKALQAINMSLGKGMNEKDMTTFSSQSFTPELCESPAICDLLKKSPLWDLAESAIGKGKIINEDRAQIALRFPQASDSSKELTPHIDGIHTPDNGVPKGEIWNFTMLVGIALSETKVPYSGNFVLWPRTHESYANHFKEHGTDDLLNGLEGMPSVTLPEPKHVLAKPGDAFFVHYQVGHTCAVNLSPHVRYGTYFRLQHKDHDAFKVEAMTDLWCGWDGINRPR